MARQLTIEEERKVLRSLFGKRCFDAGSSRMCFNLDWEIAYDLGLDNGRDYANYLANKKLNKVYNKVGLGRKR